MNKKILGFRKDLKASSQCVKIVKTANQILGMIKRTFTFKTKDNLLQLCKCLVRLHLYAGVESLFKKGYRFTEEVQHRATKMILGYKHLLRR